MGGPYQEGIRMMALPNVPIFLFPISVMYNLSYLSLII